jgi:hypothetical protein
MADVRLTQGAEDGIANRVHKDVSIRMAIQTFRVRNVHPAENEFSAGDKRMHVVSDAYVNHGRTIG